MWLGWLLGRDRHGGGLWRIRGRRLSGLTRIDGSGYGPWPEVLALDAGPERTDIFLPAIRE